MYLVAKWSPCALRDLLALNFAGSRAELMKDYSANLALFWLSHKEPFDDFLTCLLPTQMNLAFFFSALALLFEEIAHVAVKNSFSH